MSLINDALKKAQKMRAEGTANPEDGSTPPDSGAEPLQRIARRGKPAGFRSQLFLVAGVAVVTMALVGGGAYLYFGAKAPAPAPAGPASVAATTAPSAPPAALAPVTPTQVAAEPVATPAPAATLAATPAATPVAVSPEPALSQPVLPNPAPAIPAATVAATPATDATPSTPPVAAPPERPKPSTRMIGVIEHYKVGGIRVAGAESKVLMNDKVYRVNDIVDHELGIKLTGIETKALTFEDARGAVHTRYF